MKSLLLILVVLFTACHTPSWENETTVNRPPRYTEYHFNVDSSGYDIYNEDMKLIGRLKYGANPTLDSLIDKDNQ